MMIIFHTVQTDSLSTMDVSGRYSENPTSDKFSSCVAKGALPCGYFGSAISDC
jgi:hypothetical protein